MGMFDNVNFKCSCPYCNGPVDGFQSKDGPSLMLDLEPWMINRFYTSCSKCKKWIEYVKIPQEQTDDDITSFVDDGYKAYSLLKVVMQNPDITIPENIKAEIDTFLASTCFPKDESWLKNYILLPQKDKDNV